jgi:hypothetical protein
MEILKDKGKKITIFGYEYTLTISLRTISRMTEKLGSLEELMLNYETIPVILSLMVQDYCEKHPDAPTEACDAETLRSYLDPTDIRHLQEFIQSILNPKQDEESKNA